jgi:hypothetical protein
MEKSWWTEANLTIPFDYSRTAGTWSEAVSAATGPAVWRRAVALFAVLVPLTTAQTAWCAPTTETIGPYKARYSLYRNGKLSGKVDIELTQEGDHFAVRSEGGGTHGLARILAARNTEEVSGRIDGGRLLPEQHVRHTRVAGIDDRWVTAFDWNANQAVVRNDDNIWRLDLQGRALDPLTLKLEMRRRLDDPEPDLRFLMVDEDEIDEENFRILETEWLETSIGCIEAIPVEKIRRAGNKRYTRAWHAPDLSNVEVRVEHGKTDGNHIEMRITELSLNGVDVIPRPACSALQSAGGASSAFP